MAFNKTNPISVGDATKKSHYDRVFDNTLALAGIGIPYFLGGDWFTLETSTSFTAIKGLILVQIDGSVLAANNLVAYFEAFFRGGNASNPVYCDLYNLTDAGIVSGSELTVTSATPLRVRSSALSLPAATKEYYARNKAPDAGTPIYTNGCNLILLKV